MADRPAIRQVTIAAFGRSEEAELVDALRRRGVFICSLVAIIQGKIVGHVMFTPAWIESGERSVDVAALGPLSVSPAYQRQGIGSRLTTAGLDRCRQAGYGIAIVLGHPDYYPRFGFVPSYLHGIRWEYEAPVEAFMVMELIPGSLGDVAGIAHFQPEFNLV